MSAQLFQIAAVDATVYFTVSLMLMLVAVIACAVPTFRATRIDPATTLRNP
jgi:ABC-type lipoprotein release transport system permease subunit